MQICYKAIALGCCLFLVSNSFNCLAQQQQVHNNNHPIHAKHRIAFGLGHTSISNGEINGKTSWLPLASWSLNYDYWLNNKWAIGLQNDWILETFLIQQKSGGSIERKNPIAVIPVGMYKFSNHWNAIGGVGMEFSKGHNLALTRLGIEYGTHISKKYEFGVAAVWDNKWNYYNSWGIAFTIGRLYY
jgi:hypothetical protein